MAVRTPHLSPHVSESESKIPPWTPDLLQSPAKSDNMKISAPLRSRCKFPRLPHLPNEIWILILHSLPLGCLAYGWTSLRLVSKMFKDEVEDHIQKILIRQIELIIECGKSKNPHRRTSIPQQSAHYTDSKALKNYMHLKKLITH